jgi:hypothetical protein
MMAYLEVDDDVLISGIRRPKKFIDISANCNGE